MTTKAAALGAAMLLCPLAGHAAGLYVGAAGAYVEHPSYDDVDSSFGGKAYLGYRFAPSPIFLEASYIDTGKADITSVPGVTLNFHGYTVGAGWFGELSPLGSGIWLRGAYYSGKSKLENDVGDSIDQKASGESVGLGGQWKPAEWFGFRMEYESLVNVKDFSANKSVGLLSLGIVFEFGSQPGLRRHASTYSSTAAEPVAAPVEAAPPSALAPAAATPPPPVPSPAFSGLPLSMDVPLKTQPRQAGQTQMTLRAGTAVHASQPLSNSDGNWYYAEDAAGHSGWIPASALPR